jgi:hypothetical protein
MKRILFFISLALLCLAGYSQEAIQTNDTIRKDALNVYMSSANHITEKNKFEFSYSYSWDNTDFNGEGIKYNIFSRNQYATILNVTSLNNHWSAGAIVAARSTVYANYKFKLTPGPAFEYDIFPYEQANRRQLRLLYHFGPEFSVYNDTTENLVLSEVLPIHSVTAAYQVV